jgi:hypothetical protein
MTLSLIIVPALSSFSTKIKMRVGMTYSSPFT